MVNLVMWQHTFICLTCCLVWRGMSTLYSLFISLYIPYPKILIDNENKWNDSIKLFAQNEQTFLLCTLHMNGFIQLLYTCKN
jgi:hypothetical protein